MRAVSSHQGSCRCNISLGHLPATFSCVCKCCDFVPATCPRYTSLLPVASVCTTQVFVAAACRCSMSLQHYPSCLATYRWKCCEYMSCDLSARMVHSFSNAQHAFRHYIAEIKWRPSKENRLTITQLKILKIPVRFLVFPCARAQRISQFGVWIIGSVSACFYSEFILFVCC